jgi:small-conductance mechanosensitive channel
MLEQSEAYDTHDEVLRAPHPLEKAANPRPIEVAAERPALPEPQAEVLAPQPSEAEKAAAEQAKAEAEKAERQRQEAAEKAELEAEQKRAEQWVADKKAEMGLLDNLEAYDKFVYDNNRQVRSLARKFRDLHKDYQTSLEKVNARLLDKLNAEPPQQEATGQPSAEYRILMSDIIICPDAIKLMALEADLEEMRPRLSANEIAEAESAIAGTRSRFA